MTMSDSPEAEADMFLGHTPETVTPTSYDGAGTNANTALKQNISSSIYFPPENPNKDEREVFFNGATRIVVPGDNAEISADVYGARKVEVNGGIGLAGGANGLSQLLQTAAFSELLRHASSNPANSSRSNKTSAAHKGKSQS